MSALSYTFEATLERTIAEIELDILNGVVPADVKSFSELHDYVDANTYGGACEDGAPDPLEFGATLNRVQCAVDEWIKAGVRSDRTAPQLHDVIRGESQVGPLACVTCSKVLTDTESIAPRNDGSHDETCDACVCDHSEWAPACPICGKEAIAIHDDGVVALVHILLDAAGVPAPQRIAHLKERPAGFAHEALTPLIARYLEICEVLADEMRNQAQRDVQ